MPLHEAARQGMVELARDLVAQGADLHARLRPASRGVSVPGEDRGITPFLLAVTGGHVEMMQLLITLGADPQDQDTRGAGAVLLATRSRSFEAVRLLVELGIDVNVAPPSRPTALHTAIRFGEDETVEYLAAHGADFTARDQNGRTPLEEAEFEAPTHTIELMRRLAAAQPNPLP